MKNAGYVTAYKGSLTQKFTRKSWDVMGTDKYGWVLVPEVPKEVAKVPFSGRPTVNVEHDDQWSKQLEAAPTVKVQIFADTPKEPAALAHTEESEEMFKAIEKAWEKVSSTNQLIETPPTPRTRKSKKRK